MDTGARAPLRGIPHVDQLLREVDGLESVGPVVARRLVRRAVGDARTRALRGEDPGDVRAAVRALLTELSSRRVRRVINATGVVLHTNLGRAPLAADAIAALRDAAAAAAVEYDVGEGARAERAPVAAMLAAALCDAEDALVVNNNAAALLLALGALARGRDVIVSRGELIEIGGEFRLPEIMAASGATMREVGTTNRTHVRDYERALGASAALILKVHPSNYEIVGFATQPSVAEIAPVARAAGVPLMYDVGSGLLRATDGVLAGEPDAAGAIAAGADLVCFSGDKLLGGPQAGILAGRADLIDRCRRHPVARAVRADKLALAALEATLLLHARGAYAEIPAWAMLHAERADVEARARSIAGGLPAARVRDAESVPGGGSLPSSLLPSVVVAIEHARPEALARALRAHEPPVVARVEDGRVLIDPRTVVPADDAIVRAALERALASVPRT